MRLHYFRDPAGNFGDDLNPWLWPRLLPGVLNLEADAAQPDEALFVGIGTLLNHRLPAGVRKHVFGSGVGYGELPVRGPELVIHAVRGPLSAAALGLPASRAITDAAVLLRLTTTPALRPHHACGLIVTGHSQLQYDWATVCAQAGLRFISCHWSVDRVLAEMSGCRLLLCEAMHGAIVADALRIPWRPVSLYGALLDFKWRDWLASLGLDYAPQRITALHAAQPPRASPTRGQAVRRLLRACGLLRTPPAPPPTGARELARAIAELQACARGEGLLSDERRLDAHVVRFRETFHAAGLTLTPATP